MRDPETFTFDTRQMDALYLGMCTDIDVGSEEFVANREVIFAGFRKSFDEYVKVQEERAERHRKIKEGVAKLNRPAIRITLEGLLQQTNRQAKILEYLHHIIQPIDGPEENMEWCNDCDIYFEMKILVMLIADGPSELSFEQEVSEFIGVDLNE